jgi:hypothetical protein
VSAPGVIGNLLVLHLSRWAIYRKRDFSGATVSDAQNLWLSPQAKRGLRVARGQHPATGGGQ